MDYKTIYANAQIISKNPINREDEKSRSCYFYTINNIVRLIGWQRRKYSHAQAEFYKKHLLHGGAKAPKELKIKKRYAFLLPFDIAAFAAFDAGAMKKEQIALAADHICKTQNLDEGECALIQRSFKAAAGDDEAWNAILECEAMAWCLKYLRYVRDNIYFIRKKPYNILITATMSAGKSTPLFQNRLKTVFRASMTTRSTLTPQRILFSMTTSRI